jgi:hypothetical protein
MYVTAIVPAWIGAPDDKKRVMLSCQYDATIPEDQKFCLATPTGVADFQIDNPAAVAQFTVGDAYYVEFTPAPKPGG